MLEEWLHWLKGSRQSYCVYRSPESGVDLEGETLESAPSDVVAFLYAVITKCPTGESPEPILLTAVAAGPIMWDLDSEIACVVHNCAAPQVCPLGWSTCQPVFVRKWWNGLTPRRQLVTLVSLRPWRQLNVNTGGLRWPAMSLGQLTHIQSVRFLKAPANCLPEVWKAFLGMPCQRTFCSLTIGSNRHSVSGKKHTQTSAAPPGLKAETRVSTAPGGLGGLRS